ncbi:hypothetical protein PTKIN_Ptkin04bG0239200 [Pterospermum kingtungense]
MPVGFQIGPDLDLKVFSILFKTWNKCASGQLAASSEFFHSKKYSTGGFSSMEIFFWFLLSIAPSAQSLLNTQCGSAMLMQHPVKDFEKTPSRAELSQ